MSKIGEQEINRIIYLMETDKSFDAPKDALQWSKNIFLTRAAAPKKSFVKQILAVLQMDLSPNRAAFGERSATGALARQMLFQTGENSLDLRIKSDENGFSLRGQILGEGFANCVVKLGDFETTANELSEFKLANIPGGNYNLSVHSGEKEIVVQNLDLK
ncbi:MAG: hypothetical protein LH614_01160 [Pyrinomonadaceae bacterium]|nr:hypothetical protein [Pyrinomonadaceae bacterium]